MVCMVQRITSFIGPDIGNDIVRWSTKNKVITFPLV